jgi:anti-sigma factor (TIGR02949 family)
MKCNELIQYLSDYIDQKLDTELSEEVRQHLATCENCCIALDTTQKTILLYKTAGHEELPIGQRSRLFERLEAELIKRGDCPRGILLPTEMKPTKNQET